MTNAMTELKIQNDIRLKFGARNDMRLLRNNNGALKDATGRLVKYGLGTGTSDLIGWLTVTVTPEMVGREVAVFTAIEVKMPGYRQDDHVRQQAAFIGTVKHAGGIATFATCTEDVETALQQFTSGE
jgi:hypothetical protein